MSVTDPFPAGRSFALARRFRGALLVAVLVLVASLTACGDDTTTATTGDASSGASTSSESPAGGSPERIVSLSPTATEMLFAIGAGDQVVAVDDQSDFPPEAPTTDLSGYEPNVEAIADHDPELVVIADDAADITSQLERLGIDVLLQPAAMTLDDTYEQLLELGEVTGHTSDAEEVVGSIREDVAALVERAPERTTPLTYYHELDNTLFTVTSDTFIGELYSLAGLENVADGTEGAAESGGYPQLSAEFLVDADPDLVFLADTECCGQDATTFAARPGFGELTAVTEGHVVEVSDDVASRWGPRVVEFLERIVEALEAVPVE